MENSLTDLQYCQHSPGISIGPLLFILLIGDIDDGLLISILSSFADDTRTAAAVNHMQASFKQTLKQCKE